MDMITLAMAKAYSDSKGGYTEPGKVYTFDGDTSGYFTYGTDIQYVRIADEHTDPEKIVRAVVSLNGSMIEFEKKDMRIGWNGAHNSYSVFVPFGEGEAPIIIGYNTDNEGYLHIIADPNYNAFVARIEYAKTIHPIDPKYLPGVCLPVLNGVLNFDNYDEETTPMLELSEEFKAEVNTAPDGFLARCKRTVDDGVWYTTVMFLPAGLEGIMTGYNATFSFPTDPEMFGVVIMSMGGEMICQVTKH